MKYKLEYSQIVRRKLKTLKSYSLNELELKYGCNPNQKPSRVYMEDGSDLPIEVINGKPGYINLLDALNGYQLVKELNEATGKPAATSFKHVSPAGAAIGIPLTEVEKKIYWIDEDTELSPLACAYAKARGADRMSSFGDFISLSAKCDVETARLIRREVSDGIIAPDYDAEAVEILKEKKKGAYCILKMDKDYLPAPIERKQVYGVTFEQGRNEFKTDRELLKNIVTRNKELPDKAADDLMIALITLKYTQSNSVCYVKNGQAIGVGAGQQSRIHCTRLAGGKADNWYLRQSPKVLPFLPRRYKGARGENFFCFLSGRSTDGWGEREKGGGCSPKKLISFQKRKKGEGGGGRKKRLWGGALFSSSRKQIWRGRKGGGERRRQSPEAP